jgi:single-stranded DNA-binding protein
VEGRLQYSQTQTPQGETRYWTDIIVRDMIMLGSGGRTAEMEDTGKSYGRPRPDAGRASPPTREPDDDLPF